MFTGKVITSIFIDRTFNFHSQIRYLARWANRRPVKVIPSEEYDQENDAHMRQKTKINWEENYFQNKNLQNEMGNDQHNLRPLIISKKTVTPKVTIDMLETTIDEEGNFIYTKMKDNDSRITTILSEVKSNKERDKRDLMLLEGKRLIKDALDAKCKLEYILFSRFNELEYLRTSIPKIGAKLYKMPYREIQMWSNLATSPGIMGIFKIPDMETYQPPKSLLPLTIVCDNIREADNLGAILRTCSGVGCEKILLTKGCVNVWDSKVLRSACGAHFKLCLQKKIDLTSLEQLIAPDSHIYIADNKVLSLNSTVETSDKRLLGNLIESIPIIPYYGVNFCNAKHIVLIVGGETEGISEESYRLVSKLKGIRLNIPLGNNVDSLNVGTALGIIAFEMKRQCLMANNIKENKG